MAGWGLGPELQLGRVLPGARRGPARLPCAMPCLGLGANGNGERGRLRWGGILAVGCPAGSGSMATGSPAGVSNGAGAEAAGSWRHCCWLPLLPPKQRLLASAGLPGQTALHWL